MSIFGVVALTLVACSKKPLSTGALTDGEAGEASPVAAVSVAPLGSASVVDSEARRVTDLWSAAMNGHDVAQLEKVYAKRVELYGNPVSREQALVIKRSAFRDTPAFEQSISAVVVRPVDGGGWTVRFTKQSGAHGHTSSVAALLDLNFEDGVLTHSGPFFLPLTRSSSAIGLDGQTPRRA